MELQRCIYDSQQLYLRALLRLRQMLNEEASAFRDAVIQGFAFEPDALTKVASPATIDEIVRNRQAMSLHQARMPREVTSRLMA
jgi:hypothetical protein